MLKSRPQECWGLPHPFPRPPFLSSEGKEGRERAQGLELSGAGAAAMSSLGRPPFPAVKREGPEFVWHRPRCGRSVAPVAPGRLAGLCLHGEGPGEAPACPTSSIPARGGAHGPPALCLPAGEKPFECKLCHQRSRDYSAMIKHLRTHNGAAPYQCTICTEYCPSLSSMQKHMKGHKPEEIPPDWRIEKTYLYLCYV